MYHIGKNGKPARCTAKERPCPLGGEHFPDKETAQKAIDKTNAAEFDALPMPKPVRLAENMPKEAAWICEKERDEIATSDFIAEAVGEELAFSLSKEPDDFTVEIRLPAEVIDKDNKDFADMVQYFDNKDKIEKIIWSCSEVRCSYNMNDIDEYGEEFAAYNETGYLYPAAFVAFDKDNQIVEVRYGKDDDGESHAVDFSKSNYGMTAPKDALEDIIEESETSVSDFKDGRDDKADLQNWWNSTR
jgi:hypothetical protein